MTFGRHVTNVYSYENNYASKNLWLLLVCTLITTMNRFARENRCPPINSRDGLIVDKTTTAVFLIFLHIFRGTELFTTSFELVFNDTVLK